MDNELVKEYDKFFVENYKYLLGFSKSINPAYDYESLLHDCYLKCKKRIESNGYDGKEFLNFTRVTIMNTFKTNYRNKKNNVDFDLIDFNSEIESKLKFNADIEQQEKDRYAYVSYINTSAFEFVDKYFNDKEKFIFKTYYILKGKQLNYKQLALVTGYSITSVSLIIKKIKKELKINLKSFIETGLKEMEKQELIKKIINTLPLPIEKNEEMYKNLYFETFQQNWQGCHCKINNLREALKLFVEKNK